MPQTKKWLVLASIAAAFALHILQKITITNTGFHCMLHRRALVAANGKLLVDILNAFLFSAHEIMRIEEMSSIHRDISQLDHEKYFISNSLTLYISDLTEELPLAASLWPILHLINCWDLQYFFSIFNSSCQNVSGTSCSSQSHTPGFISSEPKLSLFQEMLAST